jgi:hypothetical protein
MNVKILSDDALWARLPVLAATERTTMAVLIEHLVELDERRLCVGKGFPSLYEYCVHALKFSEGESYRRIRAVRGVRKRPELLACLQDGSLTLNSLVLLHPHLDLRHGDEALRRAKGLGTRALEKVLAEYVIVPIARDSIRFVGMSPPPLKAAEPPMSLDFPSSLPPPDAPAAVTAAAPPATVAAASPPCFETAVPPQAAAPSPSPAAAPSLPPVPPPPKLVRIGFTADESLHRMVLHAQQLMRHKYPDGSLEGIFRDALRLLIEKKDLGVRAAAAAARRMGRKNKAVSAAIPPLKPP